MSRLAKLIALACFIWSLTAIITWLSIEPGEKLTGLRQPAPNLRNYQNLQRQSLETAKSTLENTALWGIQRNGQPIPPPKPAPTEEEKIIHWKALGQVIRKLERYLLIQIDNQAPNPVKEGETLPDGSKLLKLNPNSYTVETIDGEKLTVITNL